MTRARTLASRAAAVCAGAFAALAIAGVVAPGLSFAADGPQSEPRVVPASVAVPTDAFWLEPPADARCEENGAGATGADNWRWHGFIIESGRDVSTLRFGPLGPGDDYDATDGTLTAPLLTAGGEGVWQMLPALKPEGHVNPDELAGLELDPAVYKLRSGDYQIGFACTDESLTTRQWWVTGVTIDTSSAPFMTTTGAARQPAATSATTAPKAAPAAKNPGSTTTVAAVTPAAASAGTDDPEQGSAVPAVAAAAAESPAGASGISWAPLKAVRPIPGLLPAWTWALLAVVFARVAYLLARPARIRDPRPESGASPRTPTRRNATMNGIRSRLATTTVILAVFATVGVVLATARPAAAANGAQSPAPTLLPNEVATASTSFTLDFAGSVFCDGTGSAGWRAHTFIVNAGVNLADLDFGAGPLPGYIGADFDSSDGTIAAPLFRGSDFGGANFIPAATPAGLIDPASLAGYNFDPAVWNLPDGNYQIGFACTDASSATRQWWSLTVTIDADASPNAFMRPATTTTPTTTVPGQTTTTVPGQTTTTTVAGQTTTTTIPDEETTTTTIPDEETTTTSTSTPDGTSDTTAPIDTSDTGDGSDLFGDGSGSGSGDGSGGGDLPTTGIGLGSAVFGLAFIYAGRMLYLLSKRRSVTES